MIFNAFYRRGLVEQWGRGTQKIVELCVQAGHPEPEYAERTHSVGIIFHPSGYAPPYRVGVDLTLRQREILHILSTEPDIPFRTIFNRLDDAPAERTLRKSLNQLKDLGLIDFKGRGRGAVWTLVRPA